MKSNGFVYDENELYGKKILCVQEIVGGVKPTSTSTTFGLGLVSECTLNEDKLYGPVRNMQVDGRSYCVVNKGNDKHPRAFETCKKLNARLPLPRNKKEADAFFKISGSIKDPISGYSHWLNVDARNPKQTTNKAEWVDAEGKALGTRPVYQRVKKVSDVYYVM